MFPAFGEVIEDGENAWQLADVDPVSHAIRASPLYGQGNKKIFTATHHEVPTVSLHPFHLIVPVGRKVSLLRVTVGNVINAANRNDFGIEIRRATPSGSTAGLERVIPVALDPDDGDSEAVVFVDEATVTGAVTLGKFRCTYLFTTAGIASTPVTAFISPPPGAKPWIAHGGEVLQVQWFSAFPTGWTASMVWAEERE